MYIHSLTIRNLKLLSDITIDFTRNGKARMWTVLLGPNGVCKTSVLQAIAMVASGGARSRQLANVSSLIDRRQPDQPMTIDALFGFSDNLDHHEFRDYPFLDPKPPQPPRVRAALHLKPDQADFESWSGYGNDGPPELKTAIERLLARLNVPSVPLPSPSNLAPRTSLERAFHGGFFDELRNLGMPIKDLGPVATVRSRKSNLWFVAGYGVSRMVAEMEWEEPEDITVQRLASLFNRGPVIGTGFLDLFYKQEISEDTSRRPGVRSSRTPGELSREYARILKQVLIESEHLLPRIADIELRGQSGVRRTRDFMESARFDFLAGSKTVRVPATALSQGYQGMIAWVADLVGQVIYEGGGAVEPALMEGLVLIDEIDLHLHPAWQVAAVRMLRKIFPMIQFVTTTHSPMILPYLKHDEVKLLSLDDGGNVRVDDVAESPALLTASDILATYFGLDQIFPNELGEALWRYGYLASNPRRSPQEDSELSSLHDKLVQGGIEPWPPVVPRKDHP